MKKFLICLLAGMMFITPALAEGITLEGTVVATRSSAVLAPAAGVISEVSVTAGQTVAAGQTIAALQDTCTYAEVSGTVKVYGQEGESVATVTGRNGAVVYIEQDIRFTVSASTRNAYDNPENKIIHPGETVYIRCTNGSEHTGVGTVTAISGNSYSVEITEGDFEDSESVYLYRDSTYDATTRIGKGTASYNDALACTSATGTGVLTAVYVTDGMHVNAGDALFSTLEASAYSGKIQSRTEGLVASIHVSAGDAVEQHALIATVYPQDALRLQILADEADLCQIMPGQSADMTFDSGFSVQGQVELISGIPYAPETTDEETADDTVYFPVYITLPADAAISCGMTAKVFFAE